MSTRRPDELSGRAAIVGIGATEFSKNSGRSELRLAVEAVQAALDDAGLTPADVDGLVTFTMDNNPETYVAGALGIPELSFFSRVHYGGGAGCGTILHAAMAVATGIADVVVCYRAFNERSGVRFGSGELSATTAATTETTRYSWVAPAGMMTPASWIAMFAQRYLYTYGASTESFGNVAVSARRHAANNPKAHFFGAPITLEDHQASRWIAEPLRLLDCCQETDGGQALVVTSAERARHLEQEPAVIVAAAQGSGENQQMMVSYYRDDLTRIQEMEVAARQVWRTSRLSPADIDVAILYDHFTPFVLYQLETLGFCGRGEAPDFVRDGNIEVGGQLPVNTHGGLLGEAYLHGMNGIAEAVRQIRGTSCNQVDEVEHVLATAATATPTGALILGRES